VNPPTSLEDLWRVGYHADPLDFTPRHLYTWSHRFDDVEKEFRSVYATRSPATALREVLADLRRNAAAVARFISIFGEEAIEDLEPEEVPAAWRRRNVLVAARVVPDDVGVLDLTDVATRQDLEARHAELLAECGLDHLDLHEITTRRRVVTQTIAADVYRRLDVGVIRFRSSRDGGECFAILEGRATLDPTGDPVLLTDPAPDVLVEVAAEYGLDLAPAPP
jgi:hypothetical protein